MTLIGLYKGICHIKIWKSNLSNFVQFSFWVYLNTPCNLICKTCLQCVNQFAHFTIFSQKNANLGILWLIFLLLVTNYLIWQKIWNKQDQCSWATYRMAHNVSSYIRAWRVVAKNLKHEKHKKYTNWQKIPTNIATKNFPHTCEMDAV